MLYYRYKQTFSLTVRPAVAIVIVCHFVRSWMAFICQEIKDYLLAYLIRTVADYLHFAFNMGVKQKS